MLSREYPPLDSVIEPNYFSNWGDLWYPRLANKLLRDASKIAALTPNHVTVASFVVYGIGGGLIVVGGWWSVLAALLLPLSYVLDCLDGQLARYTNQSPAIGDYLDKTLDVLKILIINVAMALAAVRLTGHSYYFLLGLVSCFGFLFRYYIKLETIFSALRRDKDYLDKSSARRRELYVELDSQKTQRKTFRQQLNWLWFRHRALFALDEAEHVTLGALAALLGRPDLWCWHFAVGQMAIAMVRLIQRGSQLMSQPESLTYPLRK